MPGSPWGGKAVVAKIGARSSQRGVRLYMVPAISECNGGQGTDTFDISARWNSGSSRARRQKIYKGAGNPDDASSFVCK